MSMDWLDKAACKDVHSDVFFPPLFSEERTGPESRYYEVAKMVCEHCPVQGQCGDLGAEETHGVWAGTTPRERATASAPTPSSRVLMPYYLDKLPRQTDPYSPLNIKETWEALKAYSDKRC